MIVALLSIVSLFPSDLREECELIEANHQHDYSGRWLFDQIIFWEWSIERQTMVVRHWKPAESLQVRRSGPVYIVEWTDKTLNRRRQVVAKNLRESWTQRDPERENQKILPPFMRSGLLRDRPNSRIVEVEP
jgi:hypothetical protein